MEFSARRSSSSSQLEFLHDNKSEAAAREPHEVRETGASYRAIPVVRGYELDDEDELGDGDERSVSTAWRLFR